MVTQRQDDRPSYQGESGEFHAFEVTVGAEPLDQLRRGRDVHGEEHARLRCRRGAPDHRLGHVLLDSAHGRPGLALRVVRWRRRLPLCEGRSARQMRGEVFAGDDPARAAADDVGEVDALLARHEAHRGRRQRARTGRTRRARRRCRGCGGRRGGVVSVRAPAFPATAAAGRRLRGAVADEDRHLLALGRVGVRAVRGARPDGDERRADLDRLTRRGEQLDHGARKGARQLNDRLLGLHLHEDLVQLDRVAGGDMPRHDLRLGEALAQVGQEERSDAGGAAAHGRRHRSTSWRMRSASGRK